MQLGNWATLAKRVTEQEINFNFRWGKLQAAVISFTPQVGQHCKRGNNLIVANTCPTVAPVAVVVVVADARPRNELEQRMNLS